MSILPKNLLDMELSILSSHHRSKKYHVDPNIKKAPERSRLTQKELKKRIEDQITFFAIGKEQIDKLYNLLQG